MAEHPTASQRRVCRLLNVSRSAMGQRRTRKGRCPMVERDALEVRIKELILEFPTYGYRRIWALLKFRDGRNVNIKAVYRRMKRRSWMVNQRQPLAKPRVRASRSVAPASDVRWALTCPQ